MANLDSGLKLDLRRDEQEHVSGAMDVLVVSREQSRRGSFYATIRDAAHETEPSFLGRWKTQLELRPP